MTKRLLLNALVTVLGDFVEGLTEENLKVGVWSGKIILNHLKLNNNGIKKLKFPVDIVHGYVETLEVVIPWASLESQPVKILLQGVYLLMTPMNISSTTKQEDLLERIEQLKSQILDEIEKSVERSFQANEPQAVKNNSYFERLSTKILDNLEIELSDVHLRIEDSVTFTSQTLSCGVTIDSFAVSTTNSNWEETFIARAHNANQTQQIHKLAKLQNLSLYWTIDSPELANLSLDEWLVQMQSLIYKRDKSDSAETQRTGGERGRQGEREMGYLLEPPNTFTLKIQHNESAAAPSPQSPQFLPKIKAMIESIDLRFHLDKLQYQQIMRCIEDAKYKNRLLPLLKHKPQESVRSNPRAWWRYALILVTGRENYWTSKVSRGVLSPPLAHLSLLVRNSTSMLPISQKVYAVSSGTANHRWREWVV
jgi:vacuolar protein sorting-associated protein 13A/C